jgi:serine protease AprX
MHRYFRTFLFVFFFALCGLGLSTLEGQSAQKSDGLVKYWFYFTDKGPAGLAKFALHTVQDRLPARTKARRAKVAVNGALVDYTDLPLWTPYIEELRSLGLEPLVRSRWLNAISAFATLAQVESAGALPFIANIRKVNGFKKDYSMQANRQEIFETPELPKHFDSPFDYGSSLVQNELIHVPEVHRQGIHGEGVLIAVFDTGFWLKHEALQHLLGKVVAAYDFINHDPIVENDDEQDLPSQHVHGSQVLSVMAGYQPGQLIGPAFGADFILAKTEDLKSETPVEEDNWIAAAEWADSLGADIVSASVGYLDWYTYEDMDGNTAPITIAADLAVKKGILVVTGAGNEGNDSWHYVIAPADGDSVMAVGAVNPNGLIASFSSVGPTYDGRIKPEVVAMGVSVTGIAISANDGSSSAYSSLAGTSFSTPQAAGAAALVLSAHPQLTPMQVREALMKTADRAGAPDNTYGYGLINALNAVSYSGDVPKPPSEYHLLASYPNPFQPSSQKIARFVFDMPQDSQVTFEIYNVLGQKIATLWDGMRLAGQRQRVYWDGLSQAGEHLPAGIYFCRMQAAGFSKMVKITLLN